MNRPNVFCASLCLALLLSALASLSQAADDAPAPDYKAMVNAIFDKAAACRITGNIVRSKRHDIHYTTPDAKSLQKLRWIFLRETPRYMGKQPAENFGSNYAEDLHFTWLDAKGKVLDKADLLEGYLLFFNGDILFKSHWKEGESAPLGPRAADLAVPGIYGNLEQRQASPPGKDF